METEMRLGEFRLHWTQSDDRHFYDTLPCLDDAIEMAADILAVGWKIDRLTNWRNDEYPIDTVLELARLRLEARGKPKKAPEDDTPMTTHPDYGLF